MDNGGSNSANYRTFHINPPPQYIWDCKVPEIVEHHREHALKIQELWNIAAPSLTSVYDAAVVDFAILRDGRAVIVELNPFDEFTDACLFSWIRQPRLLRHGPEEEQGAPDDDESSCIPGTTFTMRIVNKAPTQKPAQQRWWRKILENL